jgi:oxygen-independent coproporphyrinogen-3 oxidase
MLMAIRRFLEAGYVYIGMDHFARPDDELARALGDRTLRRNFMGYTTQAGVDLIGFGPSAISELRDAYAQSERSLDAWEAAVLERGLATMRGHALTDDDRARRWVISRIMCHGELRASEYRDAFGADFASAYAAELERLDVMVNDGLVERDPDGSLRVTSLGRLLLRNVAMTFDAYLPQQRSSGAQLFSKTV